MRMRFSAANVMLGLLFLSGTMFALLWLAASISWIGFSCSAIIGYGCMALLLWVFLEAQERLFGERFRTCEPWAVMALAFLFYLAFLQIVPELGQRMMPYDSLRAQKSLEAGHVAFFRPLRFYYWVNYDLFLSVLGMVFSPRLIVGQVVNALCRALALYPVFKLSERISGHRMARLVTVLLAVSPAHTLYASTLVGDYISAMFYLYAVYFLVTRFEWERSSLNNFILWMLVGTLTGIGYLFKSITFIYLSGLGLWFFFSVLRKRTLRVVLLAGMSIVVVMTAHRAVKAGRELAFVAASEMATTPKTGNDKPGSFVDGIFYEMWLGLCIQTGGGYSPARDRAYRTADRYKKVEMVRKMLVDDRAKYPQFLIQKFRSVWGSNDSPGSRLDWFKMSCQKDCYNRKDKNYCVSWLKPLLRSEHLSLTILFLFGVSGLSLSIRKSFDRLGIGVLALTIILAFAVMSMLIESHGRYRTAIYPMFFLILPYMRVWFERENPLYVGACSLVRRLTKGLKKFDGNKDQGPSIPVLGSCSGNPAVQK